MERTGIVEWMIQRLVDPRARTPSPIRWPTCCAPTCCCSAKACATRTTPTACETTRASASPATAAGGTACLEQDRVLPSQPTMSRLLDALSGGASQEVVREAVSELALRRLWMSNQRRGRKRLMIRRGSGRWI